MNHIFKIPVHNTQDVVMLHNTLVADEYLLNRKTGNSQWNVGGVDFMELHKYFQNRDEFADCFADSLPEEIMS